MHVHILVVLHRCIVCSYFQICDRLLQGLLIAAVQMTASMRDSMHSALGSFEPVLSTVVEIDKNLPDLTPTIILTCSGAVKVRPCRVHTHTLHDSCPSCPRSIAATARDILAVI